MLEASIRSTDFCAGLREHDPPPFSPPSKGVFSVPLNAAQEDARLPVEIAPALREFWPSVGRVDNVYGDRNLFRLRADERTGLIRR